MIMRGKYAMTDGKIKREMKREGGRENAKKLQMADLMNKK